MFVSYNYYSEELQNKSWFENESYFLLKKKVGKTKKKKKKSIYQKTKVYRLLRRESNSDWIQVLTRARHPLIMLIFLPPVCGGISPWYAAIPCGLDGRDR